MSGKYSQCEWCDRALAENELLHTVDLWERVTFREVSKTKLTYLYVCGDCNDTRHEWCNGLVKEVCDKCGLPIEPGAFFLDPQLDKEGKAIQLYGLSDDESCRTICAACYTGREMY